MGVWELLGISSGIGLLAGIRLYATVLAIGLAIRFDWFTPTPAQPGEASWAILAHPAVLAIAAAGVVIELIADKVLWLDSLWDGLHTFLRPIGAVLLATAAFGNVDPAFRVVLILLCGGMALTSHASKAATRLAVNTSPEPASNIALSAAEDLMVPAGLWLVFSHPLITLGVVVVFLILFAILARQIWKLFQRRRAARRSKQAADIANSPLTS